MKTLRNVLAVLGVLALLGAAGLLTLNYFGPSEADGTAADRISLISGETLASVKASSERIGGLLTWLAVGLSILMQVGAWIAAASHLGGLKGTTAPDREKLEQLDNIEVYFDLPLYFGLLGTVISFILISVYPDAGLMFAYTSTAMGIVVSVILRLGYLTPYRKTLIRQVHQSAKA